MAEFFYSIDLTVLHFINQTISNPIFDKFFVFITDVKHWLLVYILLWFILFFTGGKKGKIAAISVLFLVFIADQTSSHLLKNIFERIRPCNALDNINVLINCPGSYSFPSSHAVNNFAVAAFFYKLYPKLKWILFTVASLVALSRPYIGVHYPFDTLAGAIIGIIIGLIFYLIVSTIDQKFSKTKL